MWVLQWIFVWLLTLPSPKEPATEELQLISFEEFAQMVEQESESLRIYNFWATWCAPCVREMPFFEKVAVENPDLELTFISMDDGRKPERVTDFVKKRQITSPVFLLNDVDYNKWIDRVYPTWSGAIPATLFVLANGERHFHEGELDEEELARIIENLNSTKP